MIEPEDTAPGGLDDLLGDPDEYQEEGGSEAITVGTDDSMVEPPVADPDREDVFDDRGPSSVALGTSWRQQLDRMERRDVEPRAPEAAPAEAVDLPQYPAPAERVREHGPQTMETLHARVSELEEQLDRLIDLLEGRNRSAPVIRNMTDHDAVRVMTGDLRHMNHKAAAEAGGLTYAQVYSCRMHYTFKHVHRDLKIAGWTNPWTSKLRK